MGFLVDYCFSVKGYCGWIVLDWMLLYIASIGGVDIASWKIVGCVIMIALTKIESIFLWMLELRLCSIFLSNFTMDDHFYLILFGWAVSMSQRMLIFFSAEWMDLGAPSICLRIELDLLWSERSDWMGLFGIRFYRGKAWWEAALSDLHGLAIRLMQK